jgi:hypothetical protein
MGLLDDKIGSLAGSYKQEKHEKLRVQVEQKNMLT